MAFKHISLVELKRCDNGSRGWYCFFARAKNSYHHIRSTQQSCLWLRKTISHRQIWGMIWKLSYNDLYLSLIWYNSTTCTKNIFENEPIIEQNYQLVMTVKIITDMMQSNSCAKHLWKWTHHSVIELWAWYDSNCYWWWHDTIQLHNPWKCMPS